MNDVMLLAVVDVKRGDVCLEDLQALFSARYRRWTGSFLEGGLAAYFLFTSKWKLSCCNTNGNWLSFWFKKAWYHYHETQLHGLIITTAFGSTFSGSLQLTKEPHGLQGAFGRSRGFGFYSALKITAQDDIRFFSLLISSESEEEGVFFQTSRAQTIQGGSHLTHSDCCLNLDRITVWSFLKMPHLNLVSLAWLKAAATLWPSINVNLL